MDIKTRKDLSKSQKANSHVSGVAGMIFAILMIATVLGATLMAERVPIGWLELIRWD